MLFHVCISATVGIDFENWKQGVEQVDDVCIMGIRL